MNSWSEQLSRMISDWEAADMTTPDRTNNGTRFIFLEERVPSFERRFSVPDGMGDYMGRSFYSVFKVQS
jgi:hypothetical protein